MEQCAKSRSVENRQSVAIRKNSKIRTVLRKPAVDNNSSLKRNDPSPWSSMKTMHGASKPESPRTTDNADFWRPMLPLSSKSSMLFRAIFSWIKERLLWATYSRCIYGPRTVLTTYLSTISVLFNLISDRHSPFLTTTYMHMRGTQLCNPHKFSSL